jgi:hypothetical protein
MLPKEVRALMADVNQRVQKAREYRVCLHPEAPTGCSAEIIKAHTVQRCGGGLLSIASKNHVYGCEPDMFQMDRLSGQLELKSIGVHDASTFRGFCGKHDQALFEPVEKHPFTGTREQVVLLTFRSVAREVWEKRVKIRTHQIMQHVVSERGTDALGALVLAATTEADQQDLGRVEQLKASLDQIVSTSNWSAIASLIVWTDHVVPILASGLTYVQYDFQGREIQDFGRPDIQWIAVNSIVDGSGGGALVLSWLAREMAPAHLAGSLMALPEAERAAAAARFIVEHVENHYVSPTWWDALGPAERQTFLNHLNGGVVPFRPHTHAWFDPSAPLSLGVTVRATTT